MGDEGSEECPWLESGDGLVSVVWEREMPLYSS